MSERRIGSIDEVFEVVSGDFTRGDEEGVEFECEFSKREFGPVVLPVFGKMGEMSGNVKSTVGCKSTKNGLGGKENDGGQLPRFSASQFRDSSDSGSNASETCWTNSDPSY